MHVFSREQIETVLASIDLIPLIEEGFVAYSDGRAVIPPVGELTFEQPPGDVHIKYGYIKGGEYYVIKIASGFYENPKRDLPSSDGLMLLFRQETGESVAVLLDQGLLTDIRTAAAGAIAAKYLAPKNVGRIGIMGTGTQARLQLEYLRGIVDCNRAVVWGRGDEQLRRFKDDMARQGFEIQTTRQAGDVGESCNLIVTTTPATAPLLLVDQINCGTHITAMGSDTPGKQELDAGILARADVVIADSKSQCLIRGEIANAVEAGLLGEDEFDELGSVIAGNAPGRTSDEQITVADLTGVAVQDMQIAKAVYEELLEQSSVNG